MTTKDFGPIENDYAFFMEHATEAESDAAEYVRRLAGFADGRSEIRLLDYGCGTGEFTERVVTGLGWPSDVLQMSLFEPVSHQREIAARRLARFSRQPIHCLEELPTAADSAFDLILSNHVLYYVEDLTTVLGRMRNLISPDGKLLLSIAGWDNPLLDLWRIGFEALGQPVPYHAAEDIEAALLQHGCDSRKSKVAYQLRFPDTTENRTRILRFLLGEYLTRIPPQCLLTELDRHTRDDHIEVNTHCYHFTVDAS